MAKPHVTRTLGPIHFEDLDPHRFEDLVHQLIYDFKQWQSIESTGRGGADDGFDVRAYEVLQTPAFPDDEEEETELPHPMEGNFAAPTHFSKAAHDKFREELRSRGVMEFYLWGAGELEDMLYQPKNDRILFAFFGISLTSRRRSRTTEIRAAVNVKNKLRRVLGDDPSHQSVLLRHLQDTHYPYKGEYKDFDKRPRWKEYSVVEFHPLGLIVSVARYYAYFDKTKTEWDFTKTVNNVLPMQGSHRDRYDAEKEELRNAVKGFWEQLPRANRVTFVSNGFIRFDSIALIDEKGDTEYGCPHIFVMDFHHERGPFSGGFEHLELNEHRYESLDGLKRVKIFPEEFPIPSFGTVYKDRFISVDDRTRTTIKHNQDGITLYDADKSYSYLKPTDVIAVDKSEDREGKTTLLKITNVRATTGKELLAACNENPSLKLEIERQISRELKFSDTIQIIEALVLYDWQIEQNRPVI